jgi:hypothetical protein
MTYSFNVKGASKTDVLLEADTKLDKLVKDMPIHELDKHGIQARYRDTVAAVADPDHGEIIILSIHGYIAWVDTTTGRKITSCSTSATASVVPNR